MNKNTTILLGAVLLITMTALYIVFQQNGMILGNHFSITTKESWCSTPDGSIKNDEEILKKLKNNPNTRLEQGNTDRGKNTSNCAVTFNKRNGSRYVTYGDAQGSGDNRCCYIEENNLPNFNMSRDCYDGKEPGVSSICYHLPKH